jgi:hypothetical protein
MKKLLSKFMPKKEPKHEFVITIQKDGEDVYTRIFNQVQLNEHKSLNDTQYNVNISAYSE